MALDSDLGSTALRAFMRGLDDGLWLKWSNGSSWFGPEQVPGSAGLIKSEISVVESPDGRLHVFVRDGRVNDNRGGLLCFFNDGTGRTLTALRVADLGGEFEGNPAAVFVGEFCHVFVRGLDNMLWRRAYDGTSWQNWQQVGFAGTMIGDPVVAKATEPFTGARYICVFFRDKDERMKYVKLQASDTASFTSFNISGGTELVGAPCGQPVATSRTGADFHVFTRRDPARDLNYFWARLSSVAWGGFGEWASLGGRFFGDPVVTGWRAFGERAGGRDVIHVFLRGEDGMLWHCWHNGASFV